MAIPSRGLRDIPTASNKVGRSAEPYRAYMQITCLEMEKARRNAERKSASDRISQIDERLQAITKEQDQLIELLSQTSSGHRKTITRTARDETGSGGQEAFKIRY